MGAAFFGKNVVDKYFLDRQCPYTKRRPLKLKTFYWVGGASLSLFVLAVLIFGEDPETKEATAQVPDYSVSVSPADQNLAQVEASPASSHGASSNAFGGGSGIGYGSGSAAGNMSARNRSANQVIRRGENGNDPSARLPMGHGVPARLLNAILSTDSSTPVIAEVTEDVFTHGTLSIPASTRVIGNASFDNASRRVQVRFHTFVYPDGDQHSVQGVGLMLDGSAGLAGNYHSGTAKRQFGRFVGNFVGGFAEGMKDRIASQGQSGVPYEPGSLRNGILNGVALSGQDQAKSISEDLSQSKAYMTIEAGQGFVIFLEREYLP